MARPYTDPTAPWVTGALSAGVEDPRELVDPDWTPEQKARWTSLFMSLAPTLKVRGQRRSAAGLDPWAPEASWGRPLVRRDQGADYRSTEASRKANEPNVRALERSFNTYPIARDIEGGLVQGAGDLASLGARALGVVSGEPGAHADADAINRRLNAEEEAYRIAATGDSVNDTLQSAVRMSARSLATAIPMGLTGAGPAGVIAGFAASRANQALTEADGAGLRGADRAWYVGRAAAIEGGVAGVFQALGLGGFESLIGGGALTRAGAKSLLKHFLAEQVEENVTEFLDNWNQAYSKVSGPMTREQAWETAKLTTITTLLTMGAGGVYGRLRGEQQRREIAAGLAERLGWSTEQARRVVDRAADATRPRQRSTDGKVEAIKGDDFQTNLGYEVEAEASLSPHGLANFYVADEQGARALASLDSPSREQWAEFGLPRRSKAEREAVVARLRQILPPEGPVAREAWEPPVAGAAAAPPAPPRAGTEPWAPPVAKIGRMGPVAPTAPPVAPIGSEPWAPPVATNRLGRMGPPILPAPPLVGAAPPLPATLPPAPAEPARAGDTQVPKPALKLHGDGAFDFKAWAKGNEAVARALLDRYRAEGVRETGWVGPDPPPGLRPEDFERAGIPLPAVSEMREVMDRISSALARGPVRIAGPKPVTPPAAEPPKAGGIVIKGPKPAPAPKQGPDEPGERAGPKGEKLSPEELERAKAADAAARARADAGAPPKITGPKTETPPAAEKPVERKPKRTKGDKGFTRNLSDAERAELEAAKALLRKKLGQVNTGLDVDAEFLGAGLTVTKLYVKAGMRNFSELVHTLLDELGPKAKPYAHFWWQRAGGEGADDLTPKQANAIIAQVEAERADETEEEDAEEEPAPPVPETQAPKTFEQAAREIVLADTDRGAKNRAMKKLAEEHGISEGEAQERVESVMVEIGRAIALDPNKPEVGRFDAMVELYDKQPRLGHRTSEKRGLQQYSTPLPLAYALAAMSDVTLDTTLYEPTAGFGALTIAADTAKTTVNELGALRKAELERKGYAVVTGEDAAKHTPVGKFDRVLANPPFGSLTHEAHGAKAIRFGDYEIRKLEHLIAIKALDAMKDDGRAALILGADQDSPGAITDRATKNFVNYLEAHYLVSGNFEVGGNLYSHQGTTYPVRVIALAGRRASPLPLKDRVPEGVQTLTEWDDVWNKVEEVRNEAALRREGMGPTGSGEPVDAPPAGPKPATEPGGSAGPAGGDGGAADGGGKRGGPGGGKRGARGGGQPAGGPVVDAGDAAGPAPGAADRTAPGVAPETGSGDGEGAADAGRPGDAGGVRGPDAGDVVPPPPVVVKEGAVVTERQREYAPGSKAKPMGTIVPNMLAPGMAKALTQLAAKVGDIDAYVADKLGWTVEELLDGRLGAEQIDSIALAIHNVENGKSLIIGDQTGIGKGRQAAALIAYAKRQGWVPVFVTADPKLFSDMYNDTLNIGKTVNPLLLGDDDKASIKGMRADNEGKVLVKSLSTAKQSAVIGRHVAKKRAFTEDGYDAVFLPYSQIQTLRKGTTELNPRQKFLAALAEGSKALFILDESHKAAGEDSIIGTFMRGGTTDVQVRTKASKQTVKLTLPGVMNGKGVKGVVYLSATFAKRPETMPLYFKTALGIATKTATELMRAFQRGGVALQQWAANALALGGEMIRRERDFAGVRVERKVITSTPQETQEAIERQDRVAAALRAIVAYSRLVVDKIKTINDVTATNDAGKGLTGSPFSSVLHNYVSQVLLASKIDAVVAEAVESHKKGEAVVIALSNTMESFLEEYADENKLDDGDHVDMNYADVLERALRRTMRASRTGAGGVKEPVILTPEELDLEEEFERALEAVREIDDVGLPVSPIDMLHAKMRAAGLKTGELTGRELTINYAAPGPKGAYDAILKRAGARADEMDGTFSAANLGPPALLPEGDQPRLYRREKQLIKDKNLTVSAFQAGKLDVVILNASGSTGLSLHASKENPEAGRRPRHMIVAQADLNIDVVKQTLGRILRTGMAGAPKDMARYTFMSTPTEAERRPLAVLSAKLASLNANTTADAEDDVRLGAIDFINKYGDRVVSEILSDDMDLARALNIFPDRKQDGTVRTVEKAAKDATGRMAVLENERQAEFYRLVQARYNELVADLKEANEYDLEVEVQEGWAAVLDSSMEMEPATDPTKPFTSGLRLERWKVLDQRRAMKEEDLEREFGKTFGKGVSPAQHEKILREKISAYLKELAGLEKQYTGERPAEPEDDAEAGDKATQREKIRTYEEKRKRLEANRAVVTAELDALATIAGRNAFVTVKTGEGKDAAEIEYAGVLLGVTLKVPTKGNPYRPHEIRATMAVEHPRRTVTFNLARMHSFNVDVRANTVGGRYFDPGRFGKTLNPNARVDRQVFTGNLIKALAMTGRGQITTFRTQDGEAVTGLVMPQGWELKHAENDPRMAVTTGEAATNLLREVSGSSLAGFDAEGKDTAKLRIEEEKNFTGRYRMSVASAKGKGGEVYLNKGLLAITGGWHEVTGRSPKMVADNLDGKKLAKAVDYLLNDMKMSLMADGATVEQVAEAHGREVDMRFGAPDQSATAPEPVWPKTKGTRSPRGVQAVEVIRTITRLWKPLSVRGPATFRKQFKVKRALGWYTPAYGEIRMNDAYDVTTALHELGHHFDRELDKWSQRKGHSAEIKEELTRLGKDLYGARKPVGGYRSEGFAEFIREFFLGSGDLPTRAPKLYAWFTTEYLQENKDEAVKIRELQDHVTLMMTQAPRDAAVAMMRAPEQPWTAERVAANLASFEAKWIDANLPILRGMQSTGGYVPGELAPTKDAFQLATFFQGTSSSRARFVALEATTDLYGIETGPGLRATLEPITAQGAEAFEDWRVLLFASRALSRYHDRGLDPGISKADAQALVNEYKDRPHFMATVLAFTEFAHRAAIPLVQAGVMSAEEFAHMERENPIYAPMMRRVEIEGRLERMGRGGKAIHRVKGGGKLPVHDPIDAMLVQVERIHRVAMTHAVMKALVEFHDAQKGRAPFLGQFMSEIPLPDKAVVFSADKIKGYVRGVGREAGLTDEEVDEAVENYWLDNMPLPGGSKAELARNRLLKITVKGTTYQGAVSFVVNGKRRLFNVEPGMVPILQGISQSTFIPGPLGVAVRGATALARVGATGLNPGFQLVRNALRDPQTALVHGDYAMHWPILSSIQGAKESLTGGKYARAWESSGLQIGLQGAQNIDQAAALKIQLLPATQQVGAYARDPVAALRASVRKLQAVMSVTEEFSRLVEYRAAHEWATEKWKTEADARVLAGNAGSDLTVNFRGGGYRAREVNEALLFFKAAIVSLDRAARAFGLREAMPWAKEQDRAKLFARSTGRAAVSLTAMALVLYFFNKGKDWWEDLPANEKWSNLHIANKVRIPLPFEIGSVFAALPIAALEGPKAFKEALAVTLNNMSPVDLNGWHGLLRNVALLAPIADVVANADWKGQPIVSLDQQRLLPRDQFGPRTTSFARWLGAALPGDGYSPAKLEHLLDTFTGGLYRNVAGMIEKALDPSGISLSDPSTIPVLGTLFIRPGTSRLSNEFYERQRWLDTRHNSHAATLEELGELSLGTRLKDELSGLAEKRRDAIALDRPRAERDAAYNALTEQINDKIRAFNARDARLDRAAGMGLLAYRLTDPHAEASPADWALLRAADRREVIVALRTETIARAKRRGRRANLDRWDSSGDLTAFGQRLGRLLRGLASRS